MGDIRSKASQLFKFLGNVEPGVVASVLNSRIQRILAEHGKGQPGDHLDPSNNQLTPQSDACMQFEALHQPVENILSGLPSWTLEDDKQRAGDDRNRTKVNAAGGLFLCFRSFANLVLGDFRRSVRCAPRSAQISHRWPMRLSLGLQGIYG